MKHKTLLLFAIVLLASCNPKKETEQSSEPAADSTQQTFEPLVSDLYTADPSAHVFNGKIFVYPSHDIVSDVPEDDLGSHFDMKDYHVYSMDNVGGTVTDHGVVLAIADIPWAGKQLWAPDAAFKNNQYFLYFPAKDKQDVFKIGVAVSDKPEGPFKAQPKPMEGSYSIDPAVFQDDDGKFYMYFGGIWGGQLQKWQTGKYDANGNNREGNVPAIGPRIARMADDMLRFDEPIKEIQILDEAGKILTAQDNKRRFFEASWMHKYNGLYYFSYSTGDTHFICYATGTSPYGPFTYKGIILMPVIGWTNHHSIVNHNGQWYLFFHDSKLSGKTQLRNMKVTKLNHLPDGSIETIDVMAK
jgi:beta-xylosidase